MLTAFETRSLTMRDMWLVSVQAPAEDAARLLDAVRAVDPLILGAYDSNAFETAGGLEHYRPRDGAAAGAEAIPRKRPGVCELSFQLEPDSERLKAVCEALFQAHSYQEPVIIVRPVLASRSKGLDDRDNPNRWWNTTGDWMAKATRPSP